MKERETSSPAAIRRLTVLHRLTLEALRTGSRKELEFLVLNQTAAVAAYDRAYLWDVRDGVRLLGVSGEAVVAPGNVACEKRRVALARESELSDFRVIPGPSIDPDAGPESSALWLPLPVDGKPYAGLLLERFGSPAWTDEEIDALRLLAETYSGAFRLYAASAPKRVSPGVRKILPFVLVAAAFAALTLIRLPLRIVAPCEVVPANPVPVNAPLDGVIRDVMVRPGQPVAKGDVLYAFDTSVAREELDVAVREVEIARSNLERASSKAGTDKASRADARVLQNRLAQDIARLEAVRNRFAKLTVAAPEDGVVIMGEPHELLGRPVRTGEAVVTLADPEDSIVRVWLPQEDSIDFDEQRPMRVFLHADSGAHRPAELVYVAAHASEGIDGIYGFMAEAGWLGGNGTARLGQKGTAVLYGDEVTLAYWLARKPLAAVRRFLGI